MLEKLTNNSLPQTDAPGTVHAGPFAETAAFARQAVAEGRMSAEEGQRLTEKAYRDSMLAQLGGLPVERDSIQLPETEAKRGKT